MPLTQRRILLATFVLLLIGIVAGSVWSTLPPRVVVIEAGSAGGGFYATAVRYARKLEAAGIKTEIRTTEQTLSIVDKVNRGSPRADIGFSVQALEREAYPNVASAGVVEVLPLFIFYNVGLGRVSSLVSLRGKRLVMPPADSVTASTVREMLSLFDITEQNTQFTYLPVAQGVQALKSGQHDVGFAMLSPSSPLVRELLSFETLALLSVPETAGIARHLEHLKATVLPLGSYDLRRNLPDSDIAMVGGLVNVVVRNDINPAVLYVLLDAMKSSHLGQTLVSPKGEFPSVVGTALDVHPLAAQWTKTGTPWVFAHFSPGLASLIDRYWLIGLAVLLLSEVYRTLRYVFEFMELGAISMALRVLRWLDGRLAAGQALGPASAKLFSVAEKIISRENQTQQARALLERIRSAWK